MDNSILWRTSSTQHDWNDGYFLRKLVEKATQLGLIGPISWRKMGIRGDRETTSVTEIKTLLNDLPKPLPDEPPNAYLEVGGDEPIPWTIKLSIAPVDQDGKKIQGMNMAWLFFDRQWVRDAADSQELIQGFMDTHNPENTEYAFIHPYQHWLDFSDRNYQIPVTSGSMFKGIFWANFLGPGHLNEFDPEMLAAISAYKIRWNDHQGLFFITTSNIFDVETSKTEYDLIGFTGLFQNAILANSKWNKNLSP